MIFFGFMCGDEVPLPARYCSAVSAKVPGRVGAGASGEAVELSGQSLLRPKKGVVVGFSEF